MRFVINGPDYRNRSPDKIINEDVCFDSIGYLYRSLSWIEIAKRDRNVCALQYAAQDTRQAIEQLLFEEIVLSVGTKLDRADYKKCKGNSTRLKKILRKLNPAYQKLVLFTKAIASVDPDLPPIVVWDHDKITNLWSKVSTYLHWAGEPTETVKNNKWLDEGIVVVEMAAQYIWKKSLSGFTATMMPDNMQIEIRKCWDRYIANEIDIENVKKMADLALPILRNRMSQI